MFSRRRWIHGAAAVLAASAMVVVGPLETAQAAAPVAPLIPIVATEAGAGAIVGCVTSVVCGGVVAVGVLAGGAWWAYNNQDKIAEWLGQDTVTSGGQNNVPGTGWAWRGTIPNPASGPYVTYGQTYTTTNNPATDTRPFLVTCISDTGCAVANGGTTNKRWWCVDTISGQVSASSASEGSNGSTSGPGGIKFSTSSAVPCNQPYAAVAMVVDVAHGLDWIAAGNWQKARSYTVTVKCKTPGGAVRTITKTGTYYSPNGGSGSVPVPGCADGEYASGVKVESCLAGVCQTTIDWQTKTTAEGSYPNCLGSAAVLGTCELLVKFDGVSCSDTVPECAVWYDRVRFGSTRYECWWGPYKLPIANCNPLRYSYDPGAVPGTDGLPSPAPTSTNNPTYQPQPSPSPTATQTVYAQPTTGPQPSPSATRSVQPFPSVTGWPSPSASSTAGPSPNPPPVPDPSPDCMAQIWSWNPVDWVVTPIKCAFIWAFVPDPLVIGQAQTQLVDAWQSSGVGTFVTSSVDVLDPLGSLASADGTTCGGISVTIPLPGLNYSTTFLDACESPWDGIAPWSRGILTAFIIGNGVWFVLRILGVGFGWQLPAQRGGE